MNHLTAIVSSMTVVLSACTQQEPPTLPVVARQKPAPEKVYTYVEQMPQLAGGGGTQAISNDIMKRLRISGKFEPNCYRVMVYFEVNAFGEVQHAKITGSSQSVAIDSAVLQAVRLLPKLSPGHQEGRPVIVSFTMLFRIATQ
jgi:TonB family protein